MSLGIRKSDSNFLKHLENPENVRINPTLPETRVTNRKCESAYVTCYRTLFHRSTRNLGMFILDLIADGGAPKSECKVKVKSFLGHKAHRAALISVSLAHSQTPAYTARPRIRG